MASAQPYRPDIDGLRAIAVLCVVLFHTGFNLFGGGFAGVDVFFVISGFLITRLIHGELTNGTFSFGRFYVRRARRLLPALLATLALSFLCAVVLFTPYHLDKLGESLAYAVFSLSNFHFWNSAGYFDLDAQLKPLLHTWSLSIEEQFYLIWPAAMAGLLWVRRAWLAPAVLAGAGAFSLFAAERYLTVDRTAVFYLMPFRVFEFAIGAGMVWLVNRPPRHKWMLEIATASGLALIAITVFTFTEETAIPGIAALIPCFGTALLIYGGSAPYLGRVLNNPLLVRIGLISYSLYLVHWPLLVFYKYWRIGPLAFHEKLAVVAVSVALASAMYAWIETPFRRPRATRRSLSPRAFALTCAGLAAAVAAPAATASLQGGWEWRLPADTRAAIHQIRESRQARLELIRSPHCYYRRGDQTFAEFKVSSADCNHLAEHDNYVVIGDSHAADLYAALRGTYPRINLIQYTGSGCTPGRTDRCRAFLDGALEFVRLNRTRIDGVFLTGRFKKEHAAALGSYALAIRATGARLTVLGPQQEFSPEIAMLLARHGTGPKFTQIANGNLNQAVFSSDRFLKRYMRQKRIPYHSKLDILCRHGHCPVFGPGGRILYADYGHWSPAGSKHFGQMLRGHYPSAQAFFANEQNSDERLLRRGRPSRSKARRTHSRKLPPRTAKSIA